MKEKKEEKLKKKVLNLKFCNTKTKFKIINSELFRFKKHIPQTFLPLAKNPIKITFLTTQPDRQNNQANQINTQTTINNKLILIIASNQKFGIYQYHRQRSDKHQ